MVPRRAAALFLGVRTLLDFQPAAEICQNSRLPLYFGEGRSANASSNLARFVEPGGEARARARRRPVETDLQKFVRGVLGRPDPEVPRIERARSKRIGCGSGRLGRRYGHGGGR